MIPLQIVEEHNEAFSLWQSAISGGIVPKGATLIHVDHHDDMECGGYDHDFSLPIVTQDQAENFVDNAAGIADFIIPAVWEGWFSAVAVVKSVLSEKFRCEERYVRCRDKSVLRSGRAIPFVHGQFRDDPTSGYRFFTYAEGFGNQMPLQGPYVLDIDLDYFCWDDSLSTAAPKRMEITEDAFRQYQENPHHPFRLFPRRLLKVVSESGRHYLEYKEHESAPSLCSEERIAKRVNTLCSWLVDNQIKPAYIDVCRSRYSGYMPAIRWQFVEETLLKVLANNYVLDIICPKGG